MKSIEEEWETFATGVLRGVSANQRSEMRKAFYAGVWALMKNLMECGQDHNSEDTGFEYLEARHQEMLKFTRDLINEAAKRN